MARYRELLKTVARRNEQVNDWFICDRGRFSNAVVNAPDRPRQASADGSPLSMDAALDALVERISEFLELHGPASLAIVGSPRMSLESNLMAARLQKVLGAGTLSYFVDSGRAEQTMKATSLLATGKSASQDDIRHADLLVIADTDLLEEAPMLALAVRQAWRNGAQVFLMQSSSDSTGEERQKGSLPFEYLMAKTLSDVPLSNATRPVIICGIDEPWLETVQSLVDTQTAFAFVFSAPNDFGCALLSREYGAVALDQAIAEPRVKGIIAFEADLPAELIQGIRVLGAADWRPTTVLAQAEVVLPATAWVEQDGTFVNNEGRAQRFKQVMQPGLPISGLTQELHPPREHRHDTPGGDLLPSWHIIAKVLERLGENPVEPPLSGQWQSLQKLDAESAGILVSRFGST